MSLSLTKKFRVDKWSGELRLDVFNAFNRVNLADPTMDLSSTNFGKVTSQLAPRRFRWVCGCGSDQRHKASAGDSR